MPAPLIIGAGSGLVSAALFASAATATALAFILLYLAPLPLFLAGLGWGTMAALVSAVAGGLVVGLSLGANSATAFTLSIAAPAALLTHLALLSRPVPAPQGTAAPQDHQATALEWYPPGRLVGWAALIASGLAGLLVLVLGYDQESYRQSIRELLKHSTFSELDGQTIESLSGVLVRALPAAFAIVWLTITLFNLWIAGLIVDASGRAQRPWPDLSSLELPNVFVLLFAGALIASFLPGVPGLIATGCAGALLFAFVLQGLAVVHVYSSGMSLRGLLLVAVYLGILLLGWVAILIAILGIAEPMLNLRDRGTKQPPQNDGTT